MQKYKIKLIVVEYR